ncbi:acetolactate decarboxylase [Desulfovibrio sp. TomC]|uniref:acetolactate decarboxylase n=1 Tax=Desulfovibrio sp. TomC TaxID=1562888 RepID=UPI0005753787|nr:acetolactate decarboxylase [Desulfovibrio sp. TomC]KHK03345.1 Alpha-acetolactate decarboxylase [Desulfovibrio sp. TomC]
MSRLALLRAAVLAVSLFVADPGRLWAATLHQTGSIEGLIVGDYAGQRSCAGLVRQGDFGLGTFADLDGEMVVLDGVVYQVTSDGVVHRARPGQLAPFAQIVRFAGSVDLGRVDGLDLPALTAALTDRLPDPSKMCAVRVDGVFPTLTVRSVPAQAKPWPPLAEAIKHQSTFPLTDIAGTLVGIYTPPGLPSLSPAGWHFHFLSHDRRHGGHVLALTTGPAKARGDAVTVLDVVYPPGVLPRGNVAKPAAGTE